MAMEKKFDMGKYSIKAARPLPVFLLLDCSSSMSGDKISNLNEAVNTMLRSFADISQREIRIQVGVITFGGSGAEYPFELQDVSHDMTFHLDADGVTPMNEALEKAKSLIEDYKVIPTNGLKPSVILITDGFPTDSEGYESDNWKEPMKKFINSGRSAQSDRFAMAIGSEDEVNMEVLEEFLNGTGQKVFTSKDASKIKDFFNAATMQTIHKALAIGTVGTTKKTNRPMLEDY